MADFIPIDNFHALRTRPSSSCWKLNWGHYASKPCWSPWVALHYFESTFPHWVSNLIVGSALAAVLKLAQTLQNVFSCRCA